MPHTIEISSALISHKARTGDVSRTARTGPQVGGGGEPAQGCIKTYHANGNIQSDYISATFHQNY